MDRKAVAKELRQRLFDFIESEHKEALQDAAIDELFEKVLAKHDTPAPARPSWMTTSTEPLLFWTSDHDFTDWTPDGCGTLITMTHEDGTTTDITPDGFYLTY